MIVEGQLEKPRNADQHRQDADTIEPLRSNAALKRTRISLTDLVAVAKERRCDWDRKSGCRVRNLKRSFGGRRRSNHSWRAQRNRRFCNGCGLCLLNDKGPGPQNLLQPKNTQTQFCKLIFKTAGRNWIHRHSLYSTKDGNSRKDRRNATVAGPPDQNFNSPQPRQFSQAVQGDSVQSARRPTPGPRCPNRKPAKRSGHCESASRDRKRCSRPGSSRFPETDSSQSPVGATQWTILVPWNAGLTRRGILPIVDRV